MNKLDKFLKPYQNFIDAIVTLFDPFVEVAIHDLQNGTLAAIYNSFSKRKIRKKSPLKELKVNIEEFGLVEKIRHREVSYREVK
jgi:predicted transcriptional regulator YheO